MSMDEILKRIAAEPLYGDGTPRRPSRDLLAALVRMGRSMRGWKAETLASFAGVSLSTVERIERAERGSDQALETVGTALGYEPGDFTRERVPLKPEETYAAAARDWGSLAPVPVAPLTKQAQLRALSRCHAMLKLGRGHDEEAATRLDELAEWIDLIGFVRSDLTPSDEPQAYARTLSRRARLCPKSTRPWHARAGGRVGGSKTLRPGLCLRGAGHLAART